jgi:hypothetical protein
MACRNASIKIDVINRLLENHKEAPITPDMVGFLPLHHAVSCDRLNVSLIERLVEVASVAVQGECAEGMTPIHLLCKHHVRRVEDCYMGRNGRDMSDLSDLREATLEVAGILLKVNHKAVRIPNRQGQLPLHTLSDTFCPDVTVVKLVTDTYGAALGLADERGDLAVHKMLRRLRLPEACDDARRPDMHTAWGSSMTCLLDFVRLHKECIKASASDGSLPLHMALFYGFGGTDFPSRRLASLIQYQWPHPKLEATVTHNGGSDSSTKSRAQSSSTTGAGGGGDDDKYIANSSAGAPETDATMEGEGEGNDNDEEEEDKSAAVELDSSDDFITLLERLLQGYPEGAKHANAGGLLPMHIVASTRRISLPVLKDLLRKYGHAVSVPVIDSYPVVTPNDVRLLSAIKVNKGGVKDVPWCLAWHGNWLDVEFSPLSRAYSRKIAVIVSAMRKGAISLLGNILKDSLDKIVETETGTLKVAAPMPHIAKNDPRFLRKRVEYYSDGDEEEVELAEDTGKMMLGSNMFQTAGF